MNIYKLYPDQSARDKLRELIDLHGHELYLARVLLLHVDDEVCERILDDINSGRLVWLTQTTSQGIKSWTKSQSTLAHRGKVSLFTARIVVQRHAYFTSPGVP